MLTNGVRRALVQRVETSRADRARVRDLARTGQWMRADDDPDRVLGYLERTSRKAPLGAEALQGDTVDFQAASFLPIGARIRRAVAYVEVVDARSAESGSGFLISPNLFLTNQHVIADGKGALHAQITFDRESDETGRPRPATSFLLDPGTFNFFSPQDELDYAIVAVGKRIAGDGSLADFGFCPLSNTPDRHVLGMNVNIIQHPNGLPKMISVRNNLLTHRTERTLLYETDTQEGSSGSPVFNDEWELVALHHWGQPFLELKDDTGKTLPNNVNEGIRISAIYESLVSCLRTLSAPQRALLREALDRAQAQVPAPPLLGPPRPSAPESKPLTIDSEDRMTRTPGEDEARIVIPIEISLRVGQPGLAVPSLRPVAVRMDVGQGALAGRALLRGPEAKRLDKDYSNRRGYSEKHIPGVTLPLPRLNQALSRQLAPLRTEEPDYEEGELKYVHFSVKLHKTRRMAIFTATNIDGATYLEVDRTSGQVKADEGETWYIDPRVSRSFFLDQTFYGSWSSIFDRGHLTRRTDPTWGTVIEAESANADTYHFTNCSPQHFRFNESIPFWQGAERYILENGMKSQDPRKPITVFQGPIFNDAVDRWADDVQIPSSFFKVIVWKGATKLKAVGLVVDQLSLLDEQRVNLGQPHEVDHVNVAQWRVAVSAIESRTGLTFGDRIRGADTISSGAQPVVGGEAQRRLRSFEDILA